MSILKTNYEGQKSKKDRRKIWNSLWFEKKSWIYGEPIIHMLWRIHPFNGERGIYVWRELEKRKRAQMILLGFIRALFWWNFRNNFIHLTRWEFLNSIHSLPVWLQDQRSVASPLENFEFRALSIVKKQRDLERTDQVRNLPWPAQLTHYSLRMNNQTPVGK